MHSLVKVLGNFKEYCQAINRATSTGAIDVIVVEQPDGEFLCSNFHVCFSMLGVLNSREKDVDIEINGMPLSLQMRLSDTGEAYFLEKHFENVGDEIYACSGTPQMPDTYLYDKSESGTIKDKQVAGSTQSLHLVGSSFGNDRVMRSKSCSSIDVSHLTSFDFVKVCPSSPRRRRLKTICRCTMNKDCFEKSGLVVCQRYCRSEGSLHAHRHYDELPMRASSEGSVNLSGKWQKMSHHLAENTAHDCRDRALVQRNLDLRQAMECLFNKIAFKNETNKCEVPEFEMSLPIDIQNTHQNTNMPIIAEEGNTIDLSTATETLDFNLNLSLYDEGCSVSDIEDAVPQYNRDFVALSLCGTDEPSDVEFQQHQLSYSMLCDNPELFRSPKLIVRIDNKYYAYSVATAHIMSIIAFKQVLAQDALERLQKLHKNETKNETVISSPNESDVEGVEAKRSWWHWKSKSPTPRKVLSTAEVTNAEKPGGNGIIESPSELHVEEGKSTLIANDGCTLAEQPQDRKIFKLNSEIIKKLNLKMGKNSMEFSVTTAFQGTTRCQCSIYRWKYDDKIIVSDIDGTITKSDVLGHLLPMVGKDWSQLGVAQLFTKIVDNGYKILYVSSRAIGQAKNTREYLNWVRQDNTPLPEGPILISPTSMLNTLHRELIERKPELFKIACLEDISALFPHRNPFYAGYGNRINDVLAYCHVGIPKARIFTINFKGEITLEQMPSLRSSYLNMANIVDHIFPPTNIDECDANEFFSCNYWRSPIDEVHLDASELYIESPTSKSGFRLRFH